MFIRMEVIGLFFFVFAVILLDTSVVEAGVIDVRSSDSSPGRSSTKIKRSNFTFDTGFKTGYFTYQIGGLVSSGNQVQFLHFPLSELRFPLNVETIRGSYKMELSNRWRVNFYLETNYSAYSGKMEDRDWGVKSYLVEGAVDNPESLDIFSRSNSDLSVMDYSLSLDKINGNHQDPFFKLTWSSYFGFGLSIQDYDFVLTNAVQEYPSVAELTPDFLPGKGLIYNFFQITPFFSAIFETPKKGQYQFFIDLSLSPFVHIADFDNHLLRNKISNGSTDGWSAKGVLSMTYRLEPKFYLFLNVSTQYTRANGWQTQVNYDPQTNTRSSAKVKLKHFSLQNNIRFGGRIQL